MLETRTKAIGAHTYEVTQLGALQGRKVFARLAKLVGGAVSAGSGEEFLASLLGSVSEEDMDYFCDTFAPRTAVHVGGKKPQLSDIFELHFAGKYDEMVKWLLFCLEVNFGSFSSALAGLKKAADQPESASK